MKNKMPWAILILFVLVSSAFVLQSYDLTGNIDGLNTLAKPGHANAADSGTRVNRSGYACATMIVNTGQADNGTATGNVVVLLDSLTGTQAWQLVDSVTVDTVDNKSYKVGYRGTRQWIRALARASGQAADTFAINAEFILGCKRAR